MFTSALSHKPLPLAHTTNPIHAHTHIFSRSSSSLHHAAATAHAIEQYRNGTRGGQNLSSRYKRLEKSLRGKEAYAQSTGSVYDAPGASGSTSTIVSAPSRKREGPRMFKGFVVPEEPKAPESDGAFPSVHNLFVPISNWFGFIGRMLYGRLRSVYPRPLPRLPNRIPHPTLRPPYLLNCPQRPRTRMASTYPLFLLFLICCVFGYRKERDYECV